MNVREVHLALNLERFNSFFDCLLSVKTQVLQVNAGAFGPCESQITARAVQPLSRVVWCVTLGHDRPPFLHVEQGQ